MFGICESLCQVLVKDIWVFERSLFHPGAYWRVCARITL
uniref:Tim44-like domain-containing protein n=1 Tax=Aegilops tauschii subsp. strangulata TaxID=200361 RepID=A0A453AWA7_AEGTS